MDNYSKAIFTVIAAALCVIAFRLLNPTHPTIGKLLDIQAMKNDVDKQNAFEAMRLEIPLVHVQSGFVVANVN